MQATPGSYHFANSSRCFLIYICLSSISRHDRRLDKLRPERLLQISTMATPMLRARQALRIIDQFDKATAESKRATRNLSTAALAGSDLDSNSRGLNNSLPETGTGRTGSLEPVHESNGERTLQRPLSYSTVDIPELATRDSASVSFNFIAFSLLCA